MIELGKFFSTNFSGLRIILLVCKPFATNNCESWLSSQSRIEYYDVYGWLWCRQMVLSIILYKQTQTQCVQLKWIQAQYIPHAAQPRHVLGGWKYFQMNCERCCESAVSCVFMLVRSTVFGLGAMHFILMLDVTVMDLWDKCCMLFCKVWILVLACLYCAENHKNECQRKSKAIEEYKCIKYIVLESSIMLAVPTWIQMWCFIHHKWIYLFSWICYILLLLLHCTQYRETKKKHYTQRANLIIILWKGCIHRKNSVSRFCNCNFR